MQKSLRLFRLIFSIIVLATITFQEASIAETGCGSLESAYGPLDYNDPNNRPKLRVVERRHFTPKVENLVGGESTDAIWADFNYTLRWFPNHHRALLAFAKYELKEIQEHRQQNKPYNPPVEGFPLTAECYFDRAIRWRPSDSNVYLIQGIYLQMKGDFDAALKAYKKSESIQPNSADLQNNLGLLYFSRKQYDLARYHAKKAYRLGYPLPGLRHKLTSVGQWP
ncbi:MAG: tetratricopeptide repeat protein [Gammaproteobacteria bacterium]|nr:tetratricopeptide repeat protein [Gammaproteobacteria bacterium]MCP5196495.1 tetratricopeptide repeat protein [Gammaproteobacteria bacterium]